jgi:acyl transferase domain-containing protein
MVKSSSDDLMSRSADDQLIAVTGIGCRFPGGTRIPGGVRDLRTLGELLRDGAEVITEIPANRWSPEFHDPAGGRQGTTVSHVGAFLDDIDRFDAAFFGISPREAGFIDPQQRLLLEVAWEAMADAGFTREQWQGSRTAVFTGMLAGDYATLHTKTLGATGIGPHYASGVEASFAAGRIAYAFDLHGPAASLSSACSSSLLAVHLAAQSLRCGECDAALAGGVNLLITPELSIFMSGIGALSPGGSCRPFDNAADGVLRGEGCGVVVLRRLADALSDGDRIYAVLLGSAVNHDGFSLGLTAPNAAAQESLLRSALISAGVGPDEVDYVEAHGTGTPLGDEIELRTLAEVYGSGRGPGRPLLVGSHKAVLGHCDAAAGMAGLLKAIWVARERYVPAQPGQRDRTSASPGIEVPGAGVTLSDLDHPVRAAVSAFGLSGTNVHLVISEYPQQTGRPAPASRPAGSVRVLLLSASTPQGLAEQAARMRPLLTDAINRGELGDLLASAALRRTHEASRRVILADDEAGLLDRIADPSAGHAGCVDPDQLPEPVFVYSGQGCQWPRMAIDLYETDATIRTTLDECDAMVREHAALSLIDELRASQGNRLAGTDVAQPAIFAVQVAVSRWLAERGVRPTAVIGHSLGEITAAHVAGCLSLRDAVRLVVLRGQVLHETAGMGRMTAVAAAEDAVRSVLDDQRSGAVIAAVNGPASVVLAGRPADLTAVTRELTGRGVRCVPLPVNYAFHSPVVAACGPRLRELLADLEPAPATHRLLSSAMPGADLERPEAAYWEKNLTDPVLLWPAIDRLLAEVTPGGWVLVEIGPHPVLTGPLTDAMRARHADGPVLSTLRRGEPGQLALHKTLAGLHVAGVDVDWERVTGRPRRYHALPVPSWAGDRYWLPGVERGQQGAGAADAGAAGVGAPQAVVGAPETTRDSDAIDFSSRVAAAVRHVLGFRPDQRLPRGRGLFELGLDSPGAVLLRARLEAEFGIELESTVVFEHPTVEALTARLTAFDGAKQEETPDSDTGEIAVIGLACRLPGADSPEEFWSMLLAGREAIGPLPPDRGRDPAWAEIGPGVPTDGGYLDDVAGFDAPFFRVSPREARSLDPQQRLFLEVGWEALEDAGVPAEMSKDAATGVYLGLNTADYQQLLTREMGSIDLYYGTGTSFAAAAGRLSYFLGLRGPSIAVDTACSASLTAVHLACQGLRDGDCELAVAGGANVIVAPTVAASMSSGGALAPDGRCKTFDEAADGYGRGEGAVALVLKPLSSARRDRDRVYAVITGSAVNADGASGGLTVPSAAAQMAVIRRALTRAGWAPADVDYVEAHGTGTPLGDPIEIRALAEALGSGRTTPLLTGSVKPNIGHLEAAAGAAGLLKIILALYHGELPPHRLDRPSSRINWRNLPVEVVTRRRAWPTAGRPARAGVSAFGFSGSNAHILLRQAPAEQKSPPLATQRVPGQQAVPPLILTAATPTALRAVAARMSARLRSATPGELAAIVHTAMYRRTWLDHRLAVDAGEAGPAGIADALDAVATDDAHSRVRFGVVGDETPDPFAADRPAGHADAAGPPVSLPGYPWERRRYWYRDEPERPEAREEDRFFGVDWVPAKAPPDVPAEPATWAVIGSSALAAGLAAELARRGHAVSPLPAPSAASASARTGRRAVWRDRLTALAAAQPPCRGVVLVADPDPPHDPAGLRDAVVNAVTLGQAMAALPQALGRLWFVTSGAYDPVGDTSVDSVHTAVWEIGRVLAMEMPGRWGGMIDTGPGADTAGHIVCALQADGVDDQMCVRDGSWYAARLVRQERMECQRTGVAADRWHVVLGDKNAAPAVTALVAAGAQRLLLAGDVPEPPPHVRWLRCGVGELEDSAATVGPLGDVIAVWTPRPTKELSGLTEHDVTAALDEPMLMTRKLTVLSGREPQRITVVASAASGWGSVNTARSAGAAGWLAGWAWRMGKPASLLALMPRGDTDELADAHRALFEQSGLRLLSAADAADLIRQALLAAPGERFAALVELRRYVRLCQDLAPRAFLSSLGPAETAGQPAAEVRDRLLALPSGLLADALLGHVIKVVATALGMTAGELDPDRGFFDLGMDSVMALAVRSGLEDDLGIELQATLTFEYSTAADLAGYLRTQLVPGEEAADVLTAEIQAAERALAAAAGRPAATEEVTWP